MALSWREIREQAITFSKEWEDSSNEDADAKSFLDAFFNVFGVSRKRVAPFESRVKKLDNNRDGNIGLPWKGTILVEMKSRGRNLDKAYSQAKDNFPGPKDHELPKYILVSDFLNFRLHDLESGEVGTLTPSELYKNQKAKSYGQHDYKRIPEPKQKIGLTFCEAKVLKSRFFFVPLIPILTLHQRPMLALRDVHKSFGDTHVLNGVSLSLEMGCVYTLKGSNGSGKTTLINIISGFLKPDKGNVEFEGKPIINFLPYHVNRLGIGRTFQDLRLAAQMTVYENILLALEKKMFANPCKEQLKRVSEILQMVSLSEKQSELAGEISYGQQKLLTIGCCIANNADMLLIDEPVAGIDQENRLKIIELVKRLKRQGKTILQIEHHPGYINATSDQILNIEKGIIC